MIYIGADHRGFELKQKLIQKLQDESIDVTDLGNNQFDQNDDYPDFAHEVAKAVTSKQSNRGIVICGSGVGVNIVANKIDGIRSVLAFNEAQVKQAREHLDVNVISLSADILDEESAWSIIQIFLKTSFSDSERHKRRLQKLQEIEETE